MTLELQRLAQNKDIDCSAKLMNASNLLIGGGLAIGPTVAGRLIEASGSLQSLLIGGGAASPCCPWC
ncbi:hypothetical protein [Pseudomonas sp. O230]|uniref:hypothetical protein n=1 Tax=Pseudomonas sp. O230 TaxID=3159450 RepID=UPI00387A8BE2